MHFYMIQIDFFLFLLLSLKILLLIFLFSFLKLNIQFFINHNEILYCFLCAFFQSTFPCFTLLRKGWCSYTRFPAFPAVRGNRNSPVERWKEFKKPDIRTSVSVYGALFPSYKSEGENVLLFYVCGKFHNSKNL